MKNWSTTKLIAAGAMGVLLAFTAFLEAPINVLTGIPGAGGIIGSFFELVVFVLGILIIKRFGAGAIIGTVAGIIALPLPILGSPGFIMKVVFGLVFGLLFDVFYLFFKRYGRWGIVLASSLVTLVFSVSFTLMISILNIPGMDFSSNIFFIFTAIFVIEAALGSFVGWHIYKKIEKTTIIRRIQR